MGLADEVRRQQQANQSADALDQQWKELGIPKNSPMILHPTGALFALVSEALPLLRSKSACFRGSAPDGSERVARSQRVQKRGLFGPKKEWEDKTNSHTYLVPISSQGKDSDNFNIAIFDDGSIAWVKRESSWDVPYSSHMAKYSDVDVVREALVKALAR